MLGNPKEELDLQTLPLEKESLIINHLAFSSKSLSTSKTGTASKKHWTPLQND
jgi:hypothetical protein